MQRTTAARPASRPAWLIDSADFWRLWFVGLVVFSVRWVETIAVGVFVYQETGSAFVVAMMTMLRLLPMGQLEGQRVLWGLHPLIERLAREAAARDATDLWSFTPALDIEGMRHEQLEARLFRS